MEETSTPARLARRSLEHFFATDEMLPVPQSLPPELSGRAGAFVSLKKNGELRGCIGTFAPTQNTVAEEIIHNAVSAAIDDPRFWPVEPDELPGISISVDILSAPERVDGFEQLDVRKYGVIVRKGRRSGLLLPDLEGVNTPEEQVLIAKQKAGIHRDEPTELYRFTVARYR